MPPGEAQDAPDDTPELLLKLRERKERHKQRHPIQRAAVVVFGFFVVLAGIVMSGPGIPGPALEFDRAERLLEKVIIWGDQVKDRAEETSTTQRIIVSFIAAVALAAFVAAAILWDIPLMPVL